MKLRMIAFVAVAAGSVLGVAPTWAWAQGAQPTLSPSVDYPLEVTVERTAQDAELAETVAKAAAKAAESKLQRVMAGRRRGPDAGIRETAAKVRDAKDEAGKMQATKELTDLLDHYFEADMQVRARELAEIASRLQKLQQQLDRRRAKKQEIIDLQVKVAINEAEGLGFYSPPSGRGGRSGGYGMDPFGGRSIDPFSRSSDMDLVPTPNTAAVPPASVIVPPPIIPR